MPDWSTSQDVRANLRDDAEARDEATRRVMEANARAVKRAGGVANFVPDEPARSTPDDE